VYIIQLLLPLYTNDKEALPKSLFEDISIQLTEKFGGLTRYIRSPAVGLWKETEQKTVQDDIIIYEVMTDSLDLAWWQSYRKELCRLFGQEEIIIRASPTQLL
jgi:hypothetical protein